MKKVLGCMRRASEEFGMLADGDRIAVGVSGGKDSMLLLYALWLYRKYMKLSYSLVAITVDLGFPGFDTAPLASFAENLDIPYIAEPTEIGKIVFDIRRESNPCALCARLRKGAFYRAAVREGANKAAFGHHSEDLMETLLMSLLYEGRLNTFSPVTHLSRCGVTLIRPFIYLPGKDIVAAARRLSLPISKNPCPANGDTKRAEIKALLGELCQRNPHAKANIMAAIRNTENYNLWDRLKRE